MQYKVLLRDIPHTQSRIICYNGTACGVGNYSFSARVRRICGCCIGRRMFGMEIRRILRER